MNEDMDRLNRSRKPAALKKLADHLAALDAEDGSNLPVDTDMLSLIVSGTLRGEDVARRYPAFYQRLLENAGLRQAFLDVLESIEAERAGRLAPLPQPTEADLSFLRRQPAAPVIDVSQKGGWRATWQRTLEQVQATLSPPQLVYRAATVSTEEPWFTLLRDEITAAGVAYAVMLDCALSDDRDDALSSFISLAVTLGDSSEPLRFPIRANLQWGVYQESILIPDEGRARFPDIPLSMIFGPDQDQLQAGFRLTLETVF